MLQWIITMLLMMIPIVNIVYIVITLRDRTANLSKKNYIKAYLIWYLVSLVLVIVLVASGLVKFLY